MLRTSPFHIRQLLIVVLLLGGVWIIFDLGVLSSSNTFSASSYSASFYSLSSKLINKFSSQNNNNNNNNKRNWIHLPPKWSNSSTSFILPTSSSSSRWIVVPASVNNVANSKERATFITSLIIDHSQLIIDGWKLVLVTDQPLPSFTDFVSELNQKALDTIRLHNELNNISQTPSSLEVQPITAIDLDTGYTYGEEEDLVLDYSSNTTSAIRARRNLLNLKSFSKQREPTARKRMLGYFFAILQGANSILHLGFEEGQPSFRSSPSFLPSQLGSGEIPCKMFFPGKDIVSPYSLFTRGSKHSDASEYPDDGGLFSGDADWNPLEEGNFSDPIEVLPPSYSPWRQHPDFDLAPQRVRLPIQQLLPSSKSTIEDHIRQIHKNNFIISQRRDNFTRLVSLWRPDPTHIAVPENTFSFFSPKLPTLFYSEAFWALPVMDFFTPSDLSSPSSPTKSEMWSLWVQRALWEIDSRISFSNGTAYTRPDDKEAYNILFENQEFLNATAEDMTLFDNLRKEWSWQSPSTGSVNSHYAFFENLWQFSLLLQERDLISHEDLDALGTWLNDLLSLGYRPLPMSTNESKQLLREREANLKERFFYGDLSGWGLNNQRDNLVENLAFGWFLNWTLHLPEPYYIINPAGQPFYWWDAKGFIGGSRLNKPAYFEYDGFWDSNFLIKKMEKRVRIVRKFPSWVEFDRSNPMVAFVLGWEKLDSYHMHRMEAQRRLWGIFSENWRMIYMQNTHTFLFPRAGMINHGETIPYRRLFESGIKLAPQLYPKVEKGIQVLREGSKTHLKEGRYVVLHWNRQSGIYGAWGTLGSIPNEHMAVWVNTFLRKVLGFPEGMPVFILGAGIDSVESIPPALREGLNVFTVKELYGDIQVSTPDGLLQEIALLNFEVALNSFIYMGTNYWSTFDDEICFMRHRVWQLTNDTIDICHAVPRGWTFKPTSIDPIFGRNLSDVFNELKDKPPITIDQDAVIPNMAIWRGYPRAGPFPEEAMKIDLTFIGITPPPPPPEPTSEPEPMVEETKAAA